MSAALINRSLTTIRTELEFLQESEVITEDLYNRILHALPQKYQKDQPAFGVDKLGAALKAPSTPSTPSDTDKLSQEFAKTAISNNVPAPQEPPRSFSPKPLGYCKALYDYKSQEKGDLELSKNDKVAVVEHLSKDWWKGYKSGANPSSAGVFPSNYVSVISEQEFESNREQAPPPPLLEKSSYSSSYHGQEKYGNKDQYNSYQPPQQMQMQPQQMPPQQMQPQPSYGGYAQYPPPSTNYYPQQQQQQQQPQAVQVDQPQHESHFKKFGSKFGNAAIFGAGATLGGDIVNSIF